MLELGFKPADVEALRRMPEARELVHWGLLVKRIGPLVGAGRPEQPVERSAQAEKAYVKQQISLGQFAYDKLVALIHVPEDED
jgi:hypothetical protein